jgi:riboflavin biosynthesis pyrimidine reductase
LSIAQQALAAGLVDEISLHIAPEVMGSGARLIDSLHAAQIRLIQVGALHGDGATHVRYRVDRT